MYEFEDIICSVDTVDLVLPTTGLSYKLAKRAQRFAGTSSFLYPGHNSFTVSNNYEVFIACFHHPSDILSLNSIKDWRRSCNKAICLVNEVWAKDAKNWANYLKLLRDFDYIFLNLSGSVSTVESIIHRPCYHITYGTDAIQFCPYPSPPQRCINAYSAGRRSPAIHAALQDLMNKQQFFYVYETIKDLFTSDYRQHRNLFSNLIKRSCYFIANNARFDTLDITGGQEELSPRFFEGIAGGAILLGTPPNNEDYRRNFNWPDAVVYLSNETSNVVDVIYELELQPERLEVARRNNITNSLERHDWVHRWREVLETIELPPNPKMKIREAQLKDLAALVASQKPYRAWQINYLR